MQNLAQTTKSKEAMETWADAMPYRYWSSWNDFCRKYYGAMFQAAAESFMTFLDVSNAPIQKIRNAMRASFDTTLRENLSGDDVSQSLARFLDCQSETFRGYKNIFIHYFDAISRFNRMLEPLRDTINRTPSENVEMGGRFQLHHYKSEIPKKHKTPILIVYSLINRHYILDLIPDVSVINQFIKDGYDVYATDWGTLDFSDLDMSLETFGHEYVERSVNKIKEITGSDQVTLFGYCWGGIFSLIYASLHPENVKNLVLHATPSDFEKKNTVIEKWASVIDPDNLTATFGNVPAFFLNLAFILRNPVESQLKYWRYFSEPRSRDEILQFFSIETWLYDSVPIVGGVYREIINQIYKENLLIKNKMVVGGKRIDLAKITMPVMSIIGEQDDLVPPNSSTKIMDVIPSEDRKTIKFPIGHVGLCISQQAHEGLWPMVKDWLSGRS